MRKHIVICCLLCGLLLTTCGCNKEDDVVPQPTTGGTTQTTGQPAQTTDPSVFNGDPQQQNGQITDPSMLGDTVDLSQNPPSSPTGQQPANGPGAGAFDSIDSPQGPSVTDQNNAVSTETASTQSTVGQNGQIPQQTQQQSVRDQINDIVAQWSNTIPKIDIELFKHSNAELTQLLKDQYPMSLRYVWGQPKVKSEPFSGGYRDTWSCSSADNSFSGKIYIQYDGTDETRSSVVSATIEILTDTNGLVNPISTTISTNPSDTTTSAQPASTTEEPAFADSGSSSSTVSTGTETTEAAGSDLNTVATKLENPATPLAEINSLLEGKTYEDLIIEWGKSDHKDANGYHWKVEHGFVSIMFDASGKFSSAKLTQAS